MNGKLLESICQLISGNNVLYMCVTRQQAEDLFRESKKIDVGGVKWRWPELTLKHKNNTLRFCHNINQLVGHSRFMCYVDEVAELPKEVLIELKRRAKSETPS